MIYTFTGNRWEFTVDYINDGNDVHLTGLFNFNNKEILFINEDGKWSQGYEFISSNRFYIPQMKYKGTVKTGTGYYTKQPYGDFVISYYTKGNLFPDIVTNENELLKIQGSWKHTNPQAKGATYTFTGDQFTFTVNDGRKPISGTVKIADSILYLIVTDEQFGIKYLDILPNGDIFLNELRGTIDLYWGPFIKQ